jgi:membrane protein implicated in regulation of membrane protease activity
MPTAALLLRGGVARATLRGMNPEPYLAWAILGVILVIAELVTGTFYLVVLGVAAFGASAAAYFGYDLPIQSIVAGLVAAAGAYWVHLYRAKSATQQMRQVDAGNPGTFENWVDQGARLARVRYRGALWDAQVDGEQAPQPGSVVYVVSTHGNTLRVSPKHPG